MGKAAYTETESIGWLLWHQATCAHLPSPCGAARKLEISECQARELLERVGNPKDDDRKVWALRYLFHHLTHGATLDQVEIMELTGYNRQTVSRMLMQLSRVVPLRNENLWFIGYGNNGHE
jgi:hypothetical protein